MANLIKLTGLWKNKNKDGKTYLTGGLGAGRIVIFPNKFKKTENHPDYFVYFSEKENKEEGGGKYKKNKKRNNDYRDTYDNDNGNNADDNNTYNDDDFEI